MIKTGGYSREGSYVLKRENQETNYTVRLHFTEGNTDRPIIEEIREIMTETCIRHFMAKGGEDLRERGRER